MPIAYRIETARLVLRCFRPADGALRKEAIDASAAHLTSTMSRWPKEPEALAVHVERARKCRGIFDLDQDQLYAILDLEERRLLGEIGLLSRAGPGARELGYWIRADATRQGFTSEAVRAVVRVAFQLHGVERVDVRCDPNNVASAGVAKKAGFVFEGTLRHRRNKPDDVPGDDLAFSMIAADFAQSPCAGQALRAFDVVGAPLALR